MKANCLIFDVDGTLLDTQEGILDSFRYTINHFGLPVPQDKELRTFIGPSPIDSFKQHFGLNDTLAKEACDFFREHYKNHSLLKAKCYEGVPELLLKLKEAGFELDVATNKRQDYAEAILEHFGLSSFFGSICGADFDGLLTKDALICMCLQNLNASPEEAVMIGDTVGDYYAAKKAGVLFLPVMYGYGLGKNDLIEDESSLRSANSPKEILSILMDLR